MIAVDTGCSARKATVGTYRIRAPYRILAGLLSCIAFLPAGLLINALRGNTMHTDLWSLGLIVTACAAAGIVAGVLAFRGHGPAAIEEDGLTEHEIVDMRERLKAKGLYTP